MWWKLATSIHRALKPSGSYEERIVASCAERLVRRKMLGQNRRDPEQAEVDRHVNRVLKAIKDSMGELGAVRRAAGGDWVEPIVAEFVDKLTIPRSH